MAPHAESAHQRVLSSLSARFPGRESQIRSLGTLLGGELPPPKNVVLYGLQATGKSSITKGLLEGLSEPYASNTDTPMLDEELHDDVAHMHYAIVKSAESITGRHLLENTVFEVAAALGSEEQRRRCEDLARLVVELGELLGASRGAQERNLNFVLVFDGIDKQRDAPSTLVPGLARLAEIIPNFTTIFIVTSPAPHMLRHSGAIHIQFPQYTKTEALNILSLGVPPIQSSTEEDTATLRSDEDEEIERRDRKELWTRFCTVVWDSLSKHTDRDVVSFRTVCKKLWPRFTQPIVDGKFTLKDFSRILVSNRSIFQDERVLVPSIISSSSLNTNTNMASQYSLGTQLPIISRFLLVAAYLASYNPTRADYLFFSRSADRTKRKKRKSFSNTTTANGQITARNRKVARKLLGAQAFVLERMLAIFHALLADAGRGSLPGGRFGGASADVQTGIATLASLRLLVKTSATADATDASAKWKVNVGWDTMRNVARSVGVELEELLLD